MKEKKAEERAAAPGGEKPDSAKAEKPEKQPEAPKKAEDKPKEPEQPKRRGRPPKADKDKAAAPKPKAPAQNPETAVKKEPEKKTAPTVQAASTPKEPEKPKDAPRRGKEQIVYIKLNELYAFKNHPFEVRDDEEMRAMVSSVKDKGVTQPAIVRPREDGGYEIVSGHRRQKASELAGYADMPCIVRNLTDDEAITQMVEDNLNQREEILPSERAKALKMQLEAIKHQGSRTSGQIDPKDAGKRSNEIVAERNKMAVKQVQRYIRLNELVPDLMKLMDEKKLGFTTAVELSYPIFCLSRGLEHLNANARWAFAQCRLDGTASLQNPLSGILAPSPFWQSCTLVPVIPPVIQSLFFFQKSVMIGVTFPHRIPTT